MPRIKRILLSDVCYHVISRGNQRQNVFCCDDDFSHFRKIAWKYKNKFDAKILSYCLMTNHIHLLIDPSDKFAINKIMHGINLAYTKHYNHKYKKCGHLWQGRFKSFVISKDSYLLNCVNYIEYNPVRAKIADKPEDYPWSSYSARMGLTNDKLLDEIIL